MSFLTAQYLVFLGILLLVYYTLGTINKKLQWIILLIASYIFYGFYSIKYMAFLLFSTLVTWGASIGISEAYHNEKAEIKADPSITKEQKKIGIIAKIPAGFIIGLDNLHNPTTNKNGKDLRKK